MTDKDIIKALECCNRPANQTSCDDCPYQFSDEKCSSKLIDNALDLINHQKAEIEAYRHYYNECLKDLKNAHIDVYRNVIEQLDAEIESSDKYIREYDDGELQIAFNKGLRAACSTVKEMQKGNL